MKKSFIYFLLMTLPLAIQAQEKYTEEFGEITQHEATMTQYDADPEAEAVVIYELGKNYFLGDDTKGMILNIEKRTKIKILKTAGKDYAEINIPFYKQDNHTFESVKDIEAIVYNFENGKLTKSHLDHKKIFEEKVNSDLYVLKIALPDVREGSIIEYKYHITTPFYFHMRKWNFQWKIPVIHSKLTYKAIPYYEYSYIVRGINEFDEFDSKVINHDIHFGGLTYKEKEYQFGMKNLPAFRDEEFISAESDYMISLNFQISKLYYPRGGSRDFISTWPAMCDDFLKRDDFGKFINNSEKEGKKILPTLNLESKTEKDKAIAIFDYVKSMYQWNGFYGKFSTDNLKRFLKEKSGNSGDINLYLIGLLKAADIKVDPLVLSTRSHGVISKSHPFQQFFNYVIAQVSINGETFLLDATEPLLYFGTLPVRCMNVEALVIKPKTEEWIATTQNKVSTTQKNFNIEVIPETSSLKVGLGHTFVGQNAYRFREIYDGKSENLSTYFKKNNNIDVKDSIKVRNYKDVSKPFSLYFNTNIGFEKSSDKLFINPFCNMTVSQNIFKQSTRTLPIDLVYLSGDEYNSKIKIPDGYKVEYLPKEINHQSRLMDIIYTISHTDNIISVSASFAFNSNLYEARDYQALKHSYAEMIKNFTDMIVLVKE